MNYLRSEHLKFKRTISNKLLFIIPLITATFAWIVGGFVGFQYTTIYWWYAFLLPGSIAILCSLSHRKEENAGNYYSVLSLPLNLSKFELAKVFILIEKLLIAAIFLAMLISVSNIISPATVVSVWQIPLCLYFARKAGLFLPIILNTVLGIFLPIALGNTVIWWLVPYCYAAKLAEPLMGIELNGTFAGGYGFSVTVLISITLSILLLFLLSYADAKDFSKRR